VLNTSAEPGEGAIVIVAASSGPPQEVQKRWSGADWEPQDGQKLVMKVIRCS
jgi:hypothetical protein